MRTSIICVGNEYQKDDGFGPEVAAYLQGRYSFPEGARVLDRSVMGYEIVPDVRECDFAVVVDALDSTGAAPGTLFEFDPEDMRASAGMLSLHEVRFADVLEAARFLGARWSTAGAGRWSAGSATRSRRRSRPARAPWSISFVPSAASMLWTSGRSLQTPGLPSGTPRATSGRP